MATSSQIANPTQFGVFRMNGWAMIKALIQNFVGLLVLDTVATPTNGTSGTYAKFAGPGSLLFHTNSGVIYRNSGTKASPVWSQLGSPVSGLGGLGTVQNAKMTYDFAVDGGAISTITPSNSPTIPVNAIVLGGTIDVTTNANGGAGATIALGFGSGAQVAALKAATGFATYAAGQVAIIPIFTAATYYKLTAAAAMTLTIATNTLTAGKLDVNIVYVQGNT